MIVKKKLESRRGERGVALVLALMVLVLLTIMAMGALFTATRGIEIAGSTRHNAKAFYVAQSGLNRAIANFLDYYSKVRSFEADPVDFKIIDLRGDNNSWGDDGTERQVVKVDTGDQIAWSDLSDPIPLHEWRVAADEYRVNYPSEETCLDVYDEGTSTCEGFEYEVVFHRLGTKKVKILSVAYRRGGGAWRWPDAKIKIESAIEFKLNIIRDSILENAVAANRGAATGSPITGNVEIHGGVHIWCEDYDPGDPDTHTAMNITGTSKIYNNYEGGGAGGSPDFLSKIDPLELDDSGNPTLEAKVQIKDCNVAFGSGAAQMGTESAPMDQIIIDGGATDGMNPLSQGAIDAQLHADEMCLTSTCYEDNLGDPPMFPDLYYELGGKTGFGNKMAYLASQNDLFGDNPEWCNIDNTTQNLRFPLNCEDPDTYDPATTQTPCQLMWDESTDKLTSYDDVLYSLDGCGTASFGPQRPGQRTIYYEGKGTFFYGDADVTITGTIMTSCDDCYPSGSGFGFMTGGEITLPDTAGEEIMGVFYGQQKITSSKQTQIAGILITDVFDVTANVPEIYQIPNLADKAMAGFNDSMFTGTLSLAAGGWRLVY